MQVLVIDNNRDLAWFGAPDLTAHVAASGPVTVHVRRGPNEDLPVSPRGFDAIVISGSKTSCLSDEPWVEKFDQFLRSAMTLKIPMLGICYGHQSIARVLGGKAVLGRSAVPEVGWTEIESLKSEPLFAGLPHRFHSFSSHFEEVKTLPIQMKNFAKSQNCAHQAASIPELGIYTLQFHPERSLVEGDKSIQARWSEGMREGLFGRGKGAQLFKPEVGEKIFANFISYAQGFKK